MTKYLQLPSTQIIVKCILGIIILSLILSTMSNYIYQDFEKYVATVNDEKISLKMFQNMYALEREKQKKILGQNFLKFSKNKTFINNTYNYVLSRLIDNILLEQYAKKIQLETNDDKVKEILLNSPMFQENKQFNKEKYFNYLSSINLTNHEYINIIKKKINTENLIHIIANSNFILENEKNNIIQLLSQKRIIQKSLIKVDPFIDKQNINNEEAQNYFDQNKKKFYTPDQFKISFFTFNINNFKTTSNDQEINEWYIKNIKKYSEKEQRRYSIIQTKTKNEAFFILSVLKNQPENFEKIAQEKSKDPISSKNSGDLGWMPIDLIPKEIKSANLNRKNQISNVIDFGNEFLIVKLNDILFEKPKKISEVYNIIKKEIQYKKSLNLYHQFQKTISQVINTHPDQLYLLFKQHNINIHETNWIDKNSIPKILNVPILKKIVFNNTSISKNKTLALHPNLIKLKNNRSFLIHIKDIKRKTRKNFQTVKNEIINQLKFDKATEETRKNAKKIIHELQQGNMNLFNQYNLSFSNPESISRYDNNPITSRIFSLPHPLKGKNLYTLYQDDNKNFIIILLKNIYNEEFSQKEKDVVSKYLEKNNTEIIFNSIIKNLRETSKITYEK